MTVSAGDAPVTTSINANVVNTTTEEGGRLEFDFTDGSFEYYSPFTETALQEAFDYVISDENGDTDSATLTINIAPDTVEGPAVASAFTVRLVIDPAPYNGPSVPESSLSKTLPDTLLANRL